MSNSILKLENNKKRINALLDEINRRKYVINVLREEMSELRKENKKLLKEINILNK